ncbi:MAG: hypothetical protein FJY29_05265 [Betaproteobacteria bacterium]|nr:hypothetical protein [Betaproteobacteria bacterium]
MMTRSNEALQRTQSTFEKRRSRLEKAQSRVEQRLAVWTRREKNFALFRLLLAVLLVMMLVGYYRSFDASQVFLGWFGFFVVFFILSAVHDRLKRVRARCEGLASVFHAEILRLERDWDALRKLRAHAAQERWQQAMSTEAEHPYRSDLDLAGLVPLWIDTCTLAEGSQRLAAEMLLRGKDALPREAYERRREAVAQLASQSKALRRWESYRMGSWSKELERPLREEEPPEQSDAAAPASAAEAKTSELTPAQRSLHEALVWGMVAAQAAFWVLYLIPALRVFLATADATHLMQPLTLYFPVLVIGALFWETWRRRVQNSTGALGLRELRVLAALEDVARRVPGDKSHRAIVPVSAGRRFRFLRTTFELGEVRRNPIVWLLLNAIIPYDALTFAVTLVAHRLIDGRFEQWWSEVVEFDFQAALARVRLENPDYCWPELSSDAFETQSLAHPLINASHRVGNEVHLNSNDRCLLLTGSNMAGKSTLLRAVGINVLLAQMGTVVCARTFRAAPLEILCAIQVSDSLESGASYFYAEVRRLAAVLARLQEKPSASGRKLFLIDEIFRGTNNRERFLGSWQVISALLGTGALGLLTTHDLALTSLEKQVAGVRNFHLRETVGADGKLEFDYLLRSGPCPTTNALIIMKQAGLPVELNFNPSV